MNRIPCPCSGVGWCEALQKTLSEKEYQLCNSGTPLAKRMVEKWTKMPGLLEQAGNLLDAAIKHIKDGAKEVDGLEYQHRIQTCEGCEFLEPAQFRCTQCGCYMKTKAKWRTSRCPKDKWLPLEMIQSQNKECGC